MDLLEIFREDVTIDDADRFLSFLKNSLPVGKYGCFSFFLKEIMSVNVLENGYR